MVMARSFSFHTFLRRAKEAPELYKQVGHELEIRRDEMLSTVTGIPSDTSKARDNRRLLELLDLHKCVITGEFLLLFLLRKPSLVRDLEIIAPFEAYQDVVSGLEALLNVGPTDSNQYPERSIPYCQGIASCCVFNPSTGYPIYVSRSTTSCAATPIAHLCGTHLFNFMTLHTLFIAYPYWTLNNVGLAMPYSVTSFHTRHSQWRDANFGLLVVTNTTALYGFPAGCLCSEKPRSFVDDITLKFSLAGEENCVDYPFDVGVRWTLDASTCGHPSCLKRNRGLVETVA